MSKVTLGKDFQPCQCCQPGITATNRFSSQEWAYLLYERGLAGQNDPELVTDPMVWSKLNNVSGQWSRIYSYTHPYPVRCWVMSGISLSAAGPGCYKVEFRGTKYLFSVDTHGICQIEFLRPLVRVKIVDNETLDSEIPVEGIGDQW